jgi:hypothetical protein
MRLHLEQIEAMQKLKGKAGQQRVTVKHVHVHEGGQAIVGAVSTSIGEEAGAIAMPNPILHDKPRGWLKNGNPPGDSPGPRFFPIFDLNLCPDYTTQTRGCPGPSGRAFERLQTTEQGRALSKKR